MFNLNLYGTPKLPDYMGTNATNDVPDASEPAPDRAPSRSAGGGGGGGERDWGRARDTQAEVPADSTNGGEGESAPTKKASEAPAAEKVRPTPRGQDVVCLSCTRVQDCRNGAVCIKRGRRFRFSRAAEHP